MLGMRLLLPLVLLSLAACADSSEAKEELSGFGGDLPRFAVLSGDDTYSSSSIGFLDADANIMAESWLHSGTTSPKLVETLGGDVAFVTEERGDGTFTVIGRYGADVVSRFDLATGEVLGQVRMREDYGVNPYDVVYTDSGRAFVVRFGRNPNDDASDLDAGNDLIEIDPSTAAILGLDEATGAIAGRIDFSAFDEDVVVGDSSLTTYASPSSVLEVGGFLVIGLGRFSLDYAAIAEGAFVVHDLEETTSTLVPLPGLRACENVTRVPGNPSAFAVHCYGKYGATEPDRGVVLFELDGEGEATEIAAYRHADYPEGEQPLGSVVVLDQTRFFGIYRGAFDSTDDPDTGYLVSFADGAAREVMRASAAGSTFGRSAFDPDTGILLVPDSNEGVRQLAVESDTIEEVRVFAFGLPGMRVRGFSKL